VTYDHAGYVDMHGATAFTSMSRRTLDYAKDRGDLPYIRAGRKILFAIADLVNWIERGRVDVTADIERLERGDA
jgi:hypothetical protein